MFKQDVFLHQKDSMRVLMMPPTWKKKIGKWGKAHRAMSNGNMQGLGKNRPAAFLSTAADLKCFEPIHLGKMSAQSTQLRWLTAREMSE